jgi:PQ loop repeat
MNIIRERLFLNSLQSLTHSSILPPAIRANIARWWALLAAVVAAATAAAAVVAPEKGVKAVEVLVGETPAVVVVEGAGAPPLTPQPSPSPPPPSGSIQRAKKGRSTSPPVSRSDQQGEKVAEEGFEQLASLEQQELEAFFSYLPLPALIMSAVVDAAMVFAPVLGYIPQYRDMARNRSAAGFSPLVSLILLVASVLRTFFWIAVRFETTLLLQALVMIFAQLVLVELVVRLNNQHPTKGLGTSESRLVVGDIGNPAWWSEHFWRWRDFASYAAFVGVLTLVLTMFALIFGESQLYGETLGMLDFVRLPSSGHSPTSSNLPERSGGGGPAPRASFVSRVLCLDHPQGFSFYFCSFDPFGLPDSPFSPCSPISFQVC